MNVYYSVDQMKSEMGRASGTYGRQSRSVGKPVGRRPLGRRRCRMECNSKMNDGGVDWVNLVQDRDKWRAVFKKVIFFVLYKMQEHC